MTENSNLETRFGLSSEKNLGLISTDVEAVIAVESRYHAKNNGVSPKYQMSRGNSLKRLSVFIFFISLFFAMMGTKGYCQARKVNFCTLTQTYCAIPACIGEDAITDLDRVRMMYDDLLECVEKVVNDNNHLTITTYYPQRQRWENDYQYKIGKSVVSVDGTALYDHEGEEISYNENYDPTFILQAEYVENYGIYTHVFESVDKADAITNLRNAGFQEVCEYEGFIIAMLENLELAINLDEFILETRIFNADKKLKNLHRTNYTMTDDGSIIPVEELMIKYDILPSGIPYEIAEVKSYLHYRVIQSNYILVNWGEELDSYDDYLRKNVKYAEGSKFGQYEEIQKRNIELKVQPNPAEESVTISLPFYMTENVEITLYNTLGVAVMSQHHNKGTRAELDIKSLPSGFYIVRCVKNDKTISARFVKQ